MIDEKTISRVSIERFYKPAENNTQVVDFEMIWITTVDGIVYGRSIRIDETCEQLKAKFEERGKLDEHCATFFDD